MSARDALKWMSAITGIGEMVQRGLDATGFEEVGLLSLSSADHSEIADVTRGLADRYEGTNTSLSLPSTRVDAFNVDLANEFTKLITIQHGYEANSKTVLTTDQMLSTLMSIKR